MAILPLVCSAFMGWGGVLMMHLRKARHIRSLFS